MRNEWGPSDGGERDRHVSGTRDLDCWPGHEPPRSGSIPLSALDQPVVNLTKTFPLLVERIQ